MHGSAFGKRPTQGIEDVPPKVIADMSKMLKSRLPDGYDLAELGRIFFGQFKTYIYPEKYGCTWITLLQSPKFSSFCTLYNEGASVKYRQPRPVVNQAQLLPPVPLPGTSAKVEPYQGNGNPSRIPYDATSEASSEDSYVSGASLVTTSAANKTRLDQERSRIHWIPREHSLEPVTFSKLLMERVVSREEPAVYIDCTYCDRRPLEGIMDAKCAIKRARADDQFSAVRNRYNEFEFESGAIFQHGAAIKMANIDALMDFGLSNPRDRTGVTQLGPNELLYFADICGGPGGYAEYFLWKKKWHAKGFGISARGKMDYNLLQAEHFPRESFETFYGDDGISGTGDICNPYNVARFSRFVRESTGGNGVHFAVGCGSDRNDYVDEDQKEVRCKYLFMAEFLIALQVVRQGGHYVSRIYDCYMPFTVGLIYLMFRTFDDVAVFKPESSLPSSSERYVICKWRKPDFHVREVINYLSDCHKVDWLAKRAHRGGKNMRDEPADIVELIAYDRIKDSRNFCEYMYRLNTDLALRQAAETKDVLSKITQGRENEYVDRRLELIQTKCNEQWQIPKVCRQKPKYSKASTAELRAMKLIVPYAFTFYQDCELQGEMELNTTNMEEEITNAKEWAFMAVGRMRGFYLCLGGNVNYHFGGAKWTEVKEKIELMNNTLVYADLVDEVKVNGANQTITAGFHIIDALILGGNDIRDLSTDERYDLIEKYALSMDKKSRPDLAKIRAKPRYPLSEFLKHMEQVKENERFRAREDGVSNFLAPVRLNRSDGTVFTPEGMMFMKITKEGFAPADCMYCLMNRFLWRWQYEPDLRVPTEFDAQRDVNMEEEEPEDKKDVVTTAKISKYLMKK